MARVRWIGSLIAVLALAGCGRAKSSGVQLTMWLVGSEAQARTVNELAKPFTQETGVQVLCEAISWGEAHSKYLTAIAGGVEPDIGTMGLTWGVEFGRLGALADLTQAFPQDIDQIRQQTFPGLWSSIEHGGRIYGIPFDLTLQTLYYRTDVIPKAPDTWEELASLLARLHRENRRMIIDWGNLSWIGYAPFLWQAGGDFYTADRARATLDSRQAAQALAFFRDLYTLHDVPKTSIPIEQGLRTGEFPLVLSGNWKIISLSVGVPELAGKWGIGLLPRGPSGKRTAFLGGRIMGIFAHSTRQAEAWRFLRYLFQPSVQQQLYNAGLKTQDAYLPPNIKSWDALAIEPGMKSVLITQAQDAQGPPAVPGWTETTNLLEAAIQRVILRGQDPNAELSAVNQAMDRALQ